MIITVYHGAKLEYNKGIFCPSYYYQLKRTRSEAEALQYSQNLLRELNDFSDRFLLQKALDDAQTTSIKSPFISTSKNRAVARSFAVSRNPTGFIYTITGPEDCFYDFNATRIKNDLPAHTTFDWMEELGIPITLTPPFEIVKIEKIIDIKEEIELIYAK